MALTLKLDCITTQPDDRKVAYMQIVDEAGAITATFDTYYDPEDQETFRIYCNGKLAAEESRLAELASARSEIEALLGGNQ